MERRYGYGSGIALTGLVLAAIQALHGVEQASTVPGATGTEQTIVLAVEAGPFVLVALALSYAGYWLATSEACEPDLPRILAWGVGSTLLFVSVSALMLFSQRVTLGTLDRSAFVAMDLVTVGAVVGVLVGLYDARSRQRRRDLQRQHDRVEAFANKAADVNNYGQALNRSESVDEISGLCIQGIGVLLGISDVAVLAVDEDGVELLDTTLQDVAARDLATLAAEARESDPASVVTTGTTEGLPDRVQRTLSINLGEHGGLAFVAIAAVSDDVAFEEEDLKLTELLASHAETALSAVRSGQVESTPGS